MAKGTEQQRRVIAMMIIWDARKGEPPKVSDWKNVRGTDWPSYQTAIRCFGSWDNALKAAGFKPRGRGRPKK